jgi:predicted  nucleic acid-binding Zn-ribbon protein
MQKLYETFAAKSPPDNTINRIVALEALTSSLTLNTDFTNLKKKVADLELKEKDHDSRIVSLESKLAALEASLTG